MILTAPESYPVRSGCYTTEIGVMSLTYDRWMLLFTRPEARFPPCFPPRQAVNAQWQ